MSKSILFLSLLFLVVTLFSCQSKQNLVEKKSDQSHNIVMFPDVPPVFPYGDLTAWVTKRLKYPEIEARNRIGGRVFIQFMIDEEGRVTDPHIMRSSGYERLDAEALRVVSGVPNWKPARLKGKKVATTYILPVTFAMRRGI